MMPEARGVEDLESVDLIMSGDHHFGWLRHVIGMEKYAKPYFEALKDLIEATRGDLVLLGDIWDLTYCSDQEIAEEFEMARPTFALAAEQQPKIPVLLSDHEPGMSMFALSQIIGPESAAWFDIQDQHFYQDERHPEFVMAHGHQLIEPHLSQALQDLAHDGAKMDLADLEQHLLADPSLKEYFAKIAQTPEGMKKWSKRICGWDKKLGGGHWIRWFVEQCAKSSVCKAHAQARFSAHAIKEITGAQMIISGHTHLTTMERDIANPGSISSHLSAPGALVVGTKTKEIGSGEEKRTVQEKVLRLLQLDRKAANFENMGDRILI